MFSRRFLACALTVLMSFVASSANAELVYRYTLTSSPGYTPGTVTGLVFLPDKPDVHVSQTVTADALTIESAPAGLPLWAPKFPVNAETWNVQSNSFSYSRSSSQSFDLFDFEALYYGPLQSAIHLVMIDNYLIPPTGYLRCLGCTGASAFYNVEGSIALTFLYGIESAPLSNDGGTSTVNVPEPASIALLGLASVALVGARRRRNAGKNRPAP